MKWQWKQKDIGTGTYLNAGVAKLPNGDKLEASFYFGPAVPFDASLLSIEVKKGLARKSVDGSYERDVNCSVAELLAMQTYNDM